MIIRATFLLLLSYIFFINVHTSISKKALNYSSLIVSMLVCWSSGLLMLDFNCSNFFFQFFETINFNYFNTLTISLQFGLDGISLLFYSLTTLLIFLCILFIWDEKKHLKSFITNIFLLEALLLAVFSTMDLFMFYAFFEAILIPMFFLIGNWGSRERKIRANALLFMYTLITSLILLSCISYIYSVTGSFNLEYLSRYPFTFQEQTWLGLGFFISFAAKIPMFPVHIWLPEAHVEAPTVGSVVLAGILLKVGVYGFLRFNLDMFRDASYYYSPFIAWLSILGILLASFSALRNTDVKRVVAYASIAHMNVIVLGLFSINYVSFQGAVYQSISHGFVSSALFFLIGMLYNRYHTRSALYFTGLVYTMPIYSVFFVFFILANIAFPGTSSFIGEFLILDGTYTYFAYAATLGAIGIILCGAYSLILCNRFLFGNSKIFLEKYIDLNLRETFILFILSFFVLYTGLNSNFIIKYITASHIMFPL